LKSLFFNTPARKKFLKSAQANNGQVTKVVETIAIAHPQVAFTLVSQGKKVFEVTPQSWEARVKEVLGQFEHIVHFEEGNLIVRGLVASPALAIMNRTGQYFYINKRPIFSPLVSRAVKDGFGTRIAEKAHPSFVLYLEIPADFVDVNVHPQKKEARFRDEGLLYRVFREAVAKAFEIPTVFAKPLTFSEPASLTPPFTFAEESVSPTYSSPSFDLSEGSPELALYFQEQQVAVVGNFFLMRKEHLLLIDLKAAHSRVLFDSLTKDGSQAQALIWPIEVQIQPGEEEIADELNAMGIECRLLGRTLAVDALPPAIEASHFLSFFMNWKEGKKLEATVVRFCRSIRKNYTMDEANQLWKELQRCKDTTYDPQGQRIWREIKQEDLEKMMRYAP
jgi:DNA mismatch repair protein MutL